MDQQKNQDAGTLGTRALTDEADWLEYYGRLNDAGWLDRQVKRPTVFDEFIYGKRGVMFELGCAASPLLGRSALAGWTVGGIDFSAPGLNFLKAFLGRHSLAQGPLIQGDVFKADTSAVRGTVDCLVSVGFLEHFERPAPLLQKWAEVLKPDGIVVSAIPNLESVNARIFERYDPAFWKQHVVYGPQAMDAFHEEAGLVPVRRAAYKGRYDIHMLIPWEHVAAKFPHPQLYRAFKLATYFGIGQPLARLPIRPGRRLSPYILGVYRKKAATN
jgi:SAM-dependent methyltransferase